MPNRYYGRILGGTAPIARPLKKVMFRGQGYWRAASYGILQRVCICITKQYMDEW